ncbi:MAG: polysaccharide deacetylase family protein [Bryobacterales bacterium]|nr:polysaccharide deacetylase family protein [Bryobacterales bacterium]
MRAVTLLYHDVVPAGCWEASGFQGAGADVYKLDRESFARHLEAIHAVHPGRLATAPGLIAGTAGDGKLSLTFDDGGASALHTADALDAWGWKGHFFITAGRIGTPAFLDRRGIQELHRRGHLIGSHSYSHPARMALCSDAELDDEWGRSAGVLEEILGEKVRIASVPGGYYSRRVAVSAARAGIGLLFNSEPVTRAGRVEGCLVLGRFSAQRGHSPQWAAAIAAGDPRLRAREYLFWNAKKLAKGLLGNRWLRLRTHLLERSGR